MKKRIIIIVLIAILAVVAIYIISNIGKSRKYIAVVTYVTHPVLNTIQSSFENHLKELIKDDSSYKIIRYNAQGDKNNLDQISQQIEALKPYLIVTISTPVTQKIMKSIDENQKLVYSFVTNPEDLGDDLTRTNSTGLSDAVNYTGNIELIKNLMGENFKMGIIYNPNEDNSVFGINRIKDLISGTNIQLILKTVMNESDIPIVVADLAKNVDCIYITGDNTVVGAAEIVVNECIADSIPVFASDEGSIIESGAMAGISVDYNKLGFETANVVKQVFDGKDPKEISRQKIPGDELIINLKTANLLHFNIPDSIISKANKVVK
jgi:putative tryptophan/tyrosine transport system substrate-binding protein